jgi:hypothetical protein
MPDWEQLGTIFDTIGKGAGLIKGLTGASGAATEIGIGREKVQTRAEALQDAIIAAQKSGNTQVLQDFLTRLQQWETGAQSAANALGGVQGLLNNQQQRFNMRKTADILADPNAARREVDVSAPGYLSKHTGKATMFAPSADTLAMLSSDALANAERPFWESQQQISHGRASTPGLSSLYGGSTAQSAIDAALAAKQDSENSQWNDLWSQYEGLRDTQQQSLQKNLAALAGGAEDASVAASKPSAGSRLLKGAGTGATIGSMILPGVGTAIGAGVGALGNLLFGGGGTSRPKTLIGAPPQWTPLPTSSIRF